MMGGWRGLLLDLEELLFPVSAAATFGALVWFVVVARDTRLWSPAEAPPSSETKPAPPIFEPTHSSDAPRSPAHTLKIASDDGAFLTKCRAGAAEWQCVVDTGATGGSALLVISRGDARRAGIDVANLDFSGWSWTANGRVQTAEAFVSRFQVGPFVIQNAPVRVNGGSLEMPLITTAFLRHYKLTISGDTMTISE